MAIYPRFHVHAGDFEAPCHSSVFPGESLFAMSDEKFCAKFRLAVYQVLLRCHVTVTVCMRI